MLEGLKASLSGWQGPALGLVFSLIGAGIGGMFTDYVKGVVIENQVKTLHISVNTLEKSVSKLFDITTEVKIENIDRDYQIGDIISRQKELRKNIEELQRFKKQAEKSPWWRWYRE